MRTFVLITVVVATVALALGLMASRGFWGERHSAGMPVMQSRVPQLSAPDAQAGEGARILFGDLHVHTTYSFDAFSISLPMYQGEGAHPPADACDYARYCSALDFWSINDHAEGLTPQQWQQTRQMVRDCNAAAGDQDDPDLVSFLGWEWTQIGTDAANHYGHKNVMLRDTAEGEVPVRPIPSREQLFPGGNNPYNAFIRLLYIATAPGGNRQAYHDFARFLQDRDELAPCAAGVAVRDLPVDCPGECRYPANTF